MASPVKISFLGGLGEIGRNCAALECGDQIVIIDCGVMFPDHDMLGIDLVLPDFTYLRERSDSIIACVLTHGHEDHAGALSYLLKDASFPIYGTPVTLGLARSRLEESKMIGRTELIEVHDGDRFQLGPFEIEVVPVTHSVPQGVALAIHTPQGTIFHSGDFKLDMHPVDGRLTDLARIGALASGDGIRLLLADSTNAGSPGHTSSESAVGAVLFDLMRSYKGRRVITACFASHLHRIQQIADAAIALGRFVAPLGRSMGRNIDMAISLGVLEIRPDRLITPEQADRMDPGKVCVISTGSQGEPMSALALLGAKENRWLQVRDGDVVVLSSHPIPGNEHAVNKVIDSLTRLGVEVVHSGIADVHASGHARAGELELYHSIARPEWFVPIHGEYTHMTHHAAIARAMGMADDRVIIAEDGDQLVLDDRGLRFGAKVPSEYIYVDGRTIGDVGTSVLSERRILGDDGVVAAIVCIDANAGELVAGPILVSRGWIHERDGDYLVDAGTERVKAVVLAALADGKTSPKEIRKVLRRAVGSYVSESTRRRPMIIPVVLSPEAG